MNEGLIISLALLGIVLLNIGIPAFFIWLIYVFVKKIILLQKSIDKRKK